MPQETFSKKQSPKLSFRHGTCLRGWMWVATPNEARSSPFQWRCSSQYQLKGEKQKNIFGIVDVLREKLDSREEKRHEFQEYNVVAKFVAKNEYEVDQRGINEYLQDYYGLFLPIAVIDYSKAKKEGKLDILKPYIKYIPYSVVPYLNKNGRIPKPEMDFSNFDVKELVQMWRKFHMEYKHLEKSYESLKKRMETCRVLSKTRKLAHEFGSLTLKPKNPVYDMKKVIEELGEDFILEYGKPDSYKLDQLYQQGLFNIKELDQFKAIKNIRLDFVVMPLDSEQKAMEFFKAKQITAAQNRMR